MNFDIDKEKLHNDSKKLAIISIVMNSIPLIVFLLALLLSKGSFIDSLIVLASNIYIITGVPFIIVGGVLSIVSMACEKNFLSNFSGIFSLYPLIVLFASMIVYIIVFFIGIYSIPIFVILIYFILLFILFKLKQKNILFKIITPAFFIILVGTSFFLFRYEIEYKIKEYSNDQTYSEKLPPFVEIYYKTSTDSEGLTHWGEDYLFYNCEEEKCSKVKYKYDEKNNIVYLSAGGYQKIIEWDYEHITYEQHYSYGYKKTETLYTY